MAVLAIAHNPVLTKDEAREIFAREFGDRYKVEKIEDIMSLKTFYRDFQIIKNPS